MSDNPAQVKRLGLVWLVCLCLQITAVAAPFVHLHADAGHETSHHDGRVVHTHLAAHAIADHHDHHEPVAVDPQPTDEASSLHVSTEPASVPVGALNARLCVQELPVAPPERVTELILSPAPVTPPHDDVGFRLSSPPDLSTSSLRGPPR